jgi:glycosyltransferase involved in cell wall biosynthesis
MTSISVVTVCFNSAKTIASTLRSVAAQSHGDREHIIIDGGSSDETLAIVRRHGAGVSRVISEPDRGVYDAMNKGVALANGDLVGFLNSDDCYADHEVLADVARAFAGSRVEFVYGDLDMIGRGNQLVRRWRTGELPRGRLTGMHIPHPVLWVRRDVLSQLSPPFDLNYPQAADVKQQLLLVNKLHARGAYVPRPLVRMRTGGISTAGLLTYVRGWRESARAYNEIHGGGGWRFAARKFSSKIQGLRFGRQVNPDAATAP